MRPIPPSLIPAIHLNATVEIHVICVVVPDQSAINELPVLWASGPESDTVRLRGAVNVDAHDDTASDSTRPVIPFSLNMRAIVRGDSPNSMARSR